MANQALKLVNGVPRMKDIGIIVKDDGSTILSEATTLNFIGNALVVDGGSNQADISIAGEDETIYDETVVVGEGGISSGTPITLPNSGTYTDYDLKIYLNGQFLEESIDYNFVGSSPRTQFSLTSDVLEGDRLHLRVEGIPGLIYDETVVVGEGGITTGTPITLPNSGTYEGTDDLEVYLGGYFLEEAIDYNIGTGSPPYTTISVTFDLLEGERLRLRVD